MSENWDRPKVNQVLDSLEKKIGSRDVRIVYTNQESYMNLLRGIAKEKLTPFQKDLLTSAANRRYSIYNNCSG